MGWDDAHIRLHQVRDMRCAVCGVRCVVWHVWCGVWYVCAYVFFHAKAHATPRITRPLPLPHPHPHPRAIAIAIANANAIAIANAPGSTSGEFSTDTGDFYVYHIGDHKGYTYIISWTCGDYFTGVEVFWTGGQSVTDSFLDKVNDIIAEESSISDYTVSSTDSTGCSSKTYTW